MIDISEEVRCKPRGVCYIVSKRHELWSTNSCNWTCIFTHPPTIMRFSSLPILQTTERNQALPHGRG